MTRKSLIEALKKAVSECGYAFHTGFAYRMDAELKTLPAAWLLPLRLVAGEGRDAGVKKYGVTLHLLCGREEGRKDACWASLEEDARAVCAALCREECVESVGILACDPGEYSLTNRGELSVTAEFTVTMPFCLTQTEKR